MLINQLITGGPHIVGIHGTCDATTCIGCAQDISSKLAASALISLGFTVIDLSGYQALPARVVNPFSPVSFSKCARDIPQAGDNFTMFKIRSSKQLCYYIGFLIFMILSSNHTPKKTGAPYLALLFLYETIMWIHSSGRRTPRAIGKASDSHLLRLGPGGSGGIFRPGGLRSASGTCTASAEHRAVNWNWSIPQRSDPENSVSGRKTI